MVRSWSLKLGLLLHAIAITAVLSLFYIQIQWRLAPELTVVPLPVLSPGSLE